MTLFGEVGQDFSQAEFKRIFRAGLDFIERGYLTGLSFIYSEERLPETRVVAHYPQESDEQIEFVKRRVIKKFSCTATPPLPRHAAYVLDPKYTEKRSFKKDYDGARFVDKNLKEYSIDDVVTSPRNKFVTRTEQDLIFDFEGVADIDLAAGYLMAVDKAGLKPWTDSVIIIVPEEGINIHSDFLLIKHYISIRRGGSEFYSIVFDNRRCLALNRQLHRFGTTKNELKRVDSLINVEFNAYMKKNLQPLRCFT